MASEAAKAIVKKYGNKLFQKAVIGYTGYEIGQALGNDEIIVRPNITISAPESHHKGEIFSDSNTTVIILLCIVIGLIVLLLAKNLLLKYIRRQVRNNSNVVEMQASPRRINV